MMPGRDRDQSAMTGGGSTSSMAPGNTAKVVDDEDMGDEF
jgi:hypothetical protein